MRNELIKLGLSSANVRLAAAFKPLEHGAKHLAEPSYAGANKEFAALVGRGNIGLGGRHVADAKSLSSALGDARSGVQLRGDFNALHDTGGLLRKIGHGRATAPQRSGILPMDQRAADPETLRSAVDAATTRVKASALASADQIRARNVLSDLVEQPITFG